jgi:8-oxo-dGTP pyrophosphatase MutT (NUDIX family)
MGAIIVPLVDRRDAIKTDHVRRIRSLVGSDELLQLPSVSIALRGSDGRLLLARHAEGGVWVLPGGAIEPGEVPADAAVREMFEETGLLVRLTGLIGVFGGPEFVVRYRNGDRTSYVMAVFQATLREGDARPDGRELLELRFVTKEETAALPTAGWMSEVLPAVFEARISDGFRGETWNPSQSSKENA